MKRTFILILLASISAAALKVVLQGSLPSSGTIGTPYSGSLSAMHGTPPYVFSVLSGTLPNGLSLSSNGQVSGTPTVAGSFQFSVTVRDSQSDSDSESFTVTISPAPVTIITNSPLPTGTVGAAY